MAEKRPPETSKDLTKSKKINDPGVVDLADARARVQRQRSRGEEVPREELVAELSVASRRAGEKIWRLPIFDDHREMVKGDAADLVNAGPARDASPLPGGAFLSYFVPW